MRSSSPHRHGVTLIASCGSLLSATLLSLVLLSMAVQTSVLLAHPDEQAVGIGLLLQMALVGAFWWWSTSASGTLLNGPFVVLVAIFFWHSSFLAARQLHVNDIFLYTGPVFAYGENQIPRAVALVSLSMACVVLGSVVAFWQRGREVGRAHGRVPGAVGEPAFGRYAFLLFAVYILITITYLAREGIGSAQDYLDIYTQASGSVTYRLYQMGKFLGVAIIALLVASARSRLTIAIAYGGTALLILASALTGARSMPFLFAVTLLVAIDYFRRRVPLVAIIGLAFAAAAASWIMVQTRAVGVGLQMLTSVNTEHPISLWHIVWNTGATLNTVLRTMTFMAATGPIHGRSFAEALVYVIPGPLVKLVAPGWMVLPPSQWLIIQSPDVPDGAGLGYSLVAEAFLNFGLSGSLIFAFIGWLVAYLFFGFRFKRDVFAGLQSLNLVVLLSLQLRNDSITYVRVLVWGSLVIWSAQWINARARLGMTIPGERFAKHLGRHGRRLLRRTIPASSSTTAP